MEQSSRKISTLTYALRDIETSLRKAARPVGAENLLRAIEAAESLPAPEFLNESRSALEAVLLGERDLPPAIIGEILDATASIDALLNEGV